MLAVILGTDAMKSGYLYVLVHPSDPHLYKIGVTKLDPETRLAQHNRNYEEYAGRVVKETGQQWQLKTYIAVADLYWAESAFWGATPCADLPYRGGIEVERMEWQWVQKGLDAAKKAGVKLPPKPLPDYVFAYTAWMRKRLEGRDIKLVGRVTSMSGKAVFRCANGHEWRTRSTDVAEGSGCPQCGIGAREAEEIWRTAKLGYVCLLIHPDRPGVIRIQLTYSRLERWYEEDIWKDWEVHRYRLVEEPVLAESLIWDLLGIPRPTDREPIIADLSTAEQAFRDLLPRMHREIALRERKDEGVCTAD
jgi:T5orf172 domain-containing protein